MCFDIISDQSINDKDVGASCNSCSRIGEWIYFLIFFVFSDFVFDVFEVFLLFFWGSQAELFLFVIMKM